MTPRARLARRRLAAVSLAVAILAIIFGAVSAAPSLYARLARGTSEPSASLGHVRSAPLIGASAVRPPSAALPRHRAHAAFLRLQGADLTPNVPLRFTGSDFLPGEVLVVTIQDQAGQPEAQLESMNSDQAGQFSEVSQAIPAGLAPGTYMLLVQGESSHRSAQASFQLHRIPPTVQLDTYTVKPEQDFGFAGSGFLPNEVVEVRLGSPMGERLAVAGANAGGNVTGRVMVPLMPEGDYSLFFVGQQSQTPTSVGLNIQGFHPWVVLDTYAPSPQARLGFTGEDFAPNEVVLVYLNRRGGEPVVRIQADGSGRFAVSAAWDVGELSGKHILIFVGELSGVVVTTTYTVVP